MITFKDLEKVNKDMEYTDIKGKNYAPCQERIKAFRKLFPTGYIKSDVLSDVDGVCIIKAEVGFNNIREDGINEEIVLGEGIAYEREGSGFINKTSYIENCQTSAVARALGMAGFGIDESMASAEEVANATIQQNNKDYEKATPSQIERIKKIYGDQVDKLLETQGVKKLEDIPLSKINELLEKIGGKNNG